MPFDAVPSKAECCPTRRRCRKDEISACEASRDSGRAGLSVRAGIRDQYCNASQNEEAAGFVIAPAERLRRYWSEQKSRERSAPIIGHPSPRHRSCPAIFQRDRFRFSSGQFLHRNSLEYIESRNQRHLCFQLAAVAPVINLSDAMMPASSAWPCTPVLAKTRRRWVFTVFGEVFSSAPISATERPDAACSATLASAKVRR